MSEWSGRDHVAPLSSERDWAIPLRPKWHCVRASIQSRLLSTVGLFKVHPCHLRRGSDQVGFSASGLSQVTEQTPARPSNISSDWL